MQNKVVIIIASNNEISLQLLIWEYLSIYISSKAEIVLGATISSQI